MEWEGRFVLGTGSRIHRGGDSSTRTSSLIRRDRSSGPVLVTERTPDHLWRKHAGLQLLPDTDVSAPSLRILKEFGDWMVRFGTQIAIRCDRFPRFEAAVTLHFANYQRIIAKDSISILPFIVCDTLSQSVHGEATNLGNGSQIYSSDFFKKRLSHFLKLLLFSHKFFFRFLPANLKGGRFPLPRFLEVLGFTNAFMILLLLAGERKTHTL